MSIELLTEKAPGAIELTATGNEYTKPCRIIAVVWVGTATAADVVHIKGRGLSDEKTFWKGQASNANNYTTMYWGWPGLHAPHGFRAEEIASGTVYVYVAE